MPPAHRARERVLNGHRPNVADLALRIGELLDQRESRNDLAILRITIPA
jgi:hypothetical protein